MKILLFYFLLTSSLLFAVDTEKNIAADKQELKKIELEKEDLRKEKIAEYVLELENIEANIENKDSVWMKSYASYLTSLDVRESLEKIKKRINFLQRIRKISVAQKDELDALVSKEKILTSQIEKLKKKDSSPFANILTPPTIDETVVITNPFDIFTGISLIKTMEKDYSDYVLQKEELSELISLLRSQIFIYKEIDTIDTDGKYKEDAKKKSKQLERFETALDTMSVTSEVYQKRLEIIEIKINKDIEVQMLKIVRIGVIVLVVFIIFFLLKLVIKKYITDNERFYTANKIITFTNFTLIILILFFNYIENVAYLVTILGFASAGIAIAMKDWFMSILGWLVIVFGGSIHVGDRIRVDMDGMKYVGDVMDISLLRMTILEDITLTSVMQNRRAGRIIFVPNNYVFTRMIANYTHSTLKTVWDGVHITISFDSNHKKAMHICKEITKKYSKGYTDITRKQLNKLRNQYSLKNTNVEPRIFSFIETNGVSIDSWYLTNAYATLTLRSVISIEIVDAFNAEDDITIAYPTQKLHVETARKKPPFDENEVV
ncbi:mechanosensitive ion channel family protein [Candidatus Sulfurimonas baltica]|uniref:Mechanosensitive ion channel n=1 Tax=Candidatus Sulfurimonas baltica TaxID=2740404 RepID=A0A7S7RP97_9BACT|nr:mechanosensitive ion channel domain-containing protein [Candidatus Sulfurimonas baltica]QOY53354.1 mechanosensitive ion channel [Candidatus Sulfurimonas baltica]